MLAHNLVKNTVIKAYENHGYMQEEIPLVSVRGEIDLNGDLPFQEMAVGCQSGSFTVTNANSSRYPHGNNEPLPGLDVALVDQITHDHLLNLRNQNSQIDPTFQQLTMLQDLSHTQTLGLNSKPGSGER